MNYYLGMDVISITQVFKIKERQWKFTIYSK